MSDRLREIRQRLEAATGPGFPGNVVTLISGLPIQRDFFAHAPEDIAYLLSLVEAGPDKRCDRCGKWQGMDRDAYCKGHGEKPL